MSRVALSFSYDGLHRKSNGWLDPIKHLQMLIAAIDAANPNGEHDVIVSAISFDIWNMPEYERMLAWEVYKRARLVLSRNAAEGHQNGAAWSIRMATEGAAALGSEYLIHLAEDTLMIPDFVEYFLEQLEDTDYVGTYWLDTESLNTQVFGCRVKAFADLKKREFLMPVEGAFYLEKQLYHAFKALGLRYKVGPKTKNAYSYPPSKKLSNDTPEPACRSNFYFHTHDADKFKQKCKLRNIKWVECEEEDEILMWYRKIRGDNTDIREHCPTLFSFGNQVSHITEFTRGVLNSTVSFLASSAKKVVTYSILEDKELERLNNLAKDRLETHGLKNFNYDISETDLLFLDDEHTYANLTVELETYADKVKKYILIHDTEIFGEIGEDGGKGLKIAINDFLQNRPEWNLQNHATNNNGLTILSRNSEFKPKDLAELLTFCGSDKDTVHSYGKFYSSLFKNKLASMKILEIGVGGESALFAYAEWCPNSQIYGINHNKNFDHSRIFTFMVDVKDQQRMHEIGKKYGPFDFIIDDGSHVLLDMLAAYYTLSNYLTEDGTYVFEDVPNEESLNYLLTIAGATSVDLRNVKNRYDDLIVIIEKNKNIIFA